MGTLNDTDIKELLRGFNGNSLHFTQYMNKLKNEDKELYDKLESEVNKVGSNLSILKPGDGK